MDAYLTMSLDERRQLCEVAGTALGLRAVSIEKYFWVCWTLRELFALPGTGPHLTFKGGTSLSKCWKLIERFSEDIDLVVDKDALGFAGDAAPDRAPSNKQRRRCLDELMAACRSWVQDKLRPALERRIAKRFGIRDGWRLEVDPEAGRVQRGFPAEFLC